MVPTKVFLKLEGAVVTISGAGVSPAADCVRLCGVGRVSASFLGASLLQASQNDEATKIARIRNCLFIMTATDSNLISGNPQSHHRAHTPGRKLFMAENLALCSLARCNASNHIENPPTDILNRLVAIDNRSCVNIDVVFHYSRDAGVCRDLDDRRDRKANSRSAPCCETDDVRSACTDSGY